MEINPTTGYFERDVAIYMNAYHHARSERKLRAEAMTDAWHFCRQVLGPERADRVDEAMHKAEEMMP